jgi:capsular exopolysaccharide synthesis family protein
VDPIEYLRGLRRRWPVIAATAAIALAIAWFTSTGPTQIETRPRIETYEASTVLFNTGRAGGSGLVNLRTMAFLASIPDVSQRVAEAVDFEGDPTQLGQRIEAVGDPNTGLLTITATSSDAEEAKLLADTFAEELLGWLSEQEQETLEAEAGALDKQLGRLERSIARLDRQIARTSDFLQRDLLTAERNARITTYGLLANQLQQSTMSATAPLGFVIIQDAVPELLPAQAGSFEAPRSRNSRLILAAILGLAVGAALALVLERFDTRIRTKEAAERHFGLPVLGEIPFISRRKRKGMTVTRKTRKGVTVVARARGRVPVVAPMPIVEDAFRLLGAGVMQAPVLNGNGREWSHAEATTQPLKTILVTSPGPSDGKTTVVANLANSLAHVGKSVLVVSCDFRHPRIHDLFGIPNNGGLGAALASGDGQLILNGHIRQTPIPGVRVITSGSPPEHPAELLSSVRMRDALAQARREADIVLVDTAPVLASADATHLFPLVDAVLVVARAKRTTAELAERTSELLKRLRAPVIGVALNGATEVPMPRRYYRYFRAS